MKRWYLFPFSLVYHFVTSVRKLLYRFGWKKTEKLNLPVIGVGNLSVGGTGKSPVVMYLSNLLHKQKEIGVLSRGYGRKTKGYMLLNYHTLYPQVGDEAMQLFLRFKNKISIVVCENRVFGAKKMMKELGVNCLILDDNLQHRALSVGLQILLTDYNDPYYKDYVLPAGNLRESRKGANRANVILVTKCPYNISAEDKLLFIKKLKANNNQKVFFSNIDYQEKIISKEKSIPIQNLEYYEVLLITGIANPKYMLQELKRYSGKVIHKKYADHHDFTKEDITDIMNTYKKMGDYKLLLCTEKDYVRLMNIEFFKEKLYYWPIEIKIDENEVFNQIIKNYVN